MTLPLESRVRGTRSVVGWVVATSAEVIEYVPGVVIVWTFEARRKPSRWRCQPWL